MKSIRYVTNVGNMPMNKFGRIFRQENQPILCFQFIFIYRVCTMMYSGSVMFLIKSLIIILSESSSLPVYDFNERKLREICVKFPCIRTVINESKGPSSSLFFCVGLASAKQPHIQWYHSLWGVKILHFGSAIVFTIPKK